MVLAWGFNPAEAARSFEGAARLAPRCAACHWGLAWALGPTINATWRPRTPPASTRHCGWRGGAVARPRRAFASSSRPCPPGTPARRADDIDEDAYADRMRALAARHPRDADIAVLAAESLLNLHPYDWWEPDGRAMPWTGEIVALLARALKLAPGHPGANHYWVHLMERSATPERALPQADRLTHAGAGFGAPAAHAGAHRHAHRPLRRGLGGQ